MNTIIGNDPQFDPSAAGRAAARGPRRGRRFQRLLWGGIGLGLVGLILAQAWFSGWWNSGAAAAVDVRPNRIDPPAYVLEAPPPPTPTAEPVAPKAPPAPAPEPTRPARSEARRARELPTKIAIDVKVEGAPAEDWYSDGRRPMLAKGCALRPGASTIPAVLETEVQSEVAGQVIASVSSPVDNVDGVIDPDTGRLKTLIQQGTKLVGIYKDDLSFNSRRIGIVWTEATMPDGRQIALADANGMDAAGAMGVGGIVSTNWGTVLAVAAVLSVFDAAQKQTVPDGTWSSGLADASANEFARTGQSITKKYLDAATRIRIPAGTPIEVSVAKTVRVC
jgi:type IV secretory pathway VirB10-like protein